MKEEYGHFAKLLEWLIVAIRLKFLWPTMSSSSATDTVTVHV